MFGRVQSGEVGRRKIQSDSGSGETRHALRPPHAVAFTRAIERLKKGLMGRGEHIPLGPTPQALIKGKLPKLPMIWKQSEAWKTVLGKHKGLIDETTVTRLPDLMGDPVLVYRQPNGRFAILLADAKGNDVLAVVAPRRVLNGSQTNLVITLHPKSSANAVVAAIRDKRVTYRHKQRSLQWLAWASRQLRGEAVPEGFPDNIPTNEDNFNGDTKYALFGDFSETTEATWNHLRDRNAGTIDRLKGAASEALADFRYYAQDKFIRTNTVPRSDRPIWSSDPQIVRSRCRNDR